MGTFGLDTLIFEHFIMVDNGRGVTIKFGDSEGNTNHTAFFRFSVVNAISRPTCTYCYGANAIPCTGSIGMRMLTVTGNGESLPDKFGAGFDVICRAESFENKVFLEDVTFKNYAQTYTTAVSSTCSGNFVFR